MNIVIIQATLEHLDLCASILKGSKLGMTYFVNRHNEYIGKTLLQDGFDKGEIYVALDDSGECVGFAWIQMNGAFHWFPFLHAMVVREDMRGMGIGGKLMAFFEEKCREERSHKAFLIVGDYNTSAIDLYEKVGYKHIGKIPDLYIKGISELLMMKDL